MKRHAMITAAWSLFVMLLAVPAAAREAAPAGGVEVAVGTTTGVPEVMPTPTPAPDAVETTATEDSTTSSEEVVDNSADQSAKKLLPAPGQTIKSTEEAVLGSTQVVAPAPPIKLVNDELVMNDGTSTEAAAVKSGAELIKRLGLKPRPPAVAGSTELEETTSGLDFNKDAVRQMIGEDPTVVYRVIIQDTPLPDPMIIPWIRNMKLLQERFDKALEMLANNQVIEGRAELLFILSEYPNTEHAAQAKAILEKLRDVLDTKPVATPGGTKTPAPPTIEINPNVKVGTVIADIQNPDDNRVMIGGRAYKAGDSIRGFPNHRIVSITEELVTIEVEVQGQKKSFDVPVRPAGAN